MKEEIKVLAIAFMILVVSLFSYGLTFFQSPENPSGRGNREATLNLSGMYCAACALNAENTFESMAGVVSADVSIKTKTGKIIYDSEQISAEELTQPELIQAYKGKIISDKKIGKVS